MQDVVIKNRLSVPCIALVAQSPSISTAFQDICPRVKRSVEGMTVFQARIPSSSNGAG